MSVYDDDLVKSVRLYGHRHVEDFGQNFRILQRPMAQILEKKHVRIWQQHLGKLSGGPIVLLATTWFYKCQSIQT